MPSESVPSHDVQIIIPARNAERWLAEALRSVLAQTYRHFVVDVVVNGSTDNTLGIAHSFRSDPRVRVHHLSEPGVSRARNLALDSSHAPIVAFVDADDRVKPHWLLTMRQALVESPAHVVGAWCNAASTDDLGNALPDFISARDELDYETPELVDFDECMVLTFPMDSIGFTIFKREAFDSHATGRIRFDESKRFGEDLDPFARVLGADGQRAFRFVDERLYEYRKHPTQTTQLGQREQTTAFVDLLDANSADMTRLGRRHLAYTLAAHIAWRRNLPDIKARMTLCAALLEADPLAALPPIPRPQTPEVEPARSYSPVI